MALAARNMSQSNPELSVTHLSLQRSLEDLSGAGSLSNKMLDSVHGRDFGEQLSLSNKRSKLVYMDKIAALELQLSSLVNTVSERAAELNNKAPKSPGIAFQSAGSKESLPKCEEVSTCWSWIVQLSRLSQIHVTYAAEYHKFFFEARDLEGCLEQEKAKVFADLSTGDRRSLGSLPFECRRLSTCMRSHLSRLILIGQRAQDLAARSGSVQPVHQRVTVAGGGKKPTTAAQEPHRAIALCSFSALDGSHVRQDEEVAVVDQTDRNVWRIEKLAAAGGGQLDVPSMCLALLGPDPEALETMGRLRDTIVAVWVQILTSYKQHVGDLLRTFLEFIQMERYTVDSDAAEASLFAFMTELEANYLCYLSDIDAAGFAKLLSQIRARRAPPPDHALRASRERRLSNVSLSSAASVDGGGGGGLGRGDSHRGSGRRTRSLRESEVIQPRALLKVLNDHVEALERLRNRRLDGPESQSQDEFLRSPGPSVPAIRVQSDDEQSNGGSNVYVFSHQEDIERLSSRTQQRSQPPEQQSRRARNLSAASSRTVTSTVVNEEVQRLSAAGVTSTDGGAGGSSLVRSSSAMGEPAPSAVEPQHVSRMYWMVNQPTKVEREIHRSDLAVGVQLAVDLPHRSFVSAKRLQLDDSGAGILAMTKVECSYPPRKEVVDAGASLDLRKESRMAQTFGDFKEVRPAVSLATQTRPPEAVDCGASRDFASAESGVRAAEKPPARREAMAQTLGEFKEVRPTTSLAAQTRPPEASDCGAFVAFASVMTGIQAVETPTPKLNQGIQTSGSFKEIQPTAALSTQTPAAEVRESGCMVERLQVDSTAGIRPASMNAGVRTAEAETPKAHQTAQTSATVVRETSCVMERLHMDSTVGIRPETKITGVCVAEAVVPKADQTAQTSVAKVSDCSAFRTVSVSEAAVTAVVKSSDASASCRPANPAASGAFFERLSVETAARCAEKAVPRSDSLCQTSPTIVAESGASIVVPMVESNAVSVAVRGMDATVGCRPRPLTDCGAHLATEAKQAAVRQSGPQAANGSIVTAATEMRSAGVAFRPAGVVSAARCRPPADAAADAASQANFQLELVGRLVVRNHSLECAQLLSLTRTVCDQEVAELTSAGQARLARDAGLQCVEWGELSSLHRAAETRREASQ